MRTTICVVLLLAPLSACSVLTIERLPDNYKEMPRFRCTSNRIAPGFDLLWTVGSMAGAVLALSYDQKAIGAVSAAGGAVYLGSSIYGYSSTSECADAMDAANEREAAGRPPGADSEFATAARHTPMQIARRFQAGRVSTVGGDGSDATLRATLAAGSARQLRVVFSGQPQHDATAMQLAVYRQTRSTGLIYENCADVGVIVDSKGEHKFAARHETGVNPTGSRWESLTADIPRATFDEIAAAQTASLRVCRDVLVIERSQFEVLRNYLQRWDAIAAEQSPATPSPAEAAPATDNAVTGCEYDAQCKGERVCVDRRCVDPPTPASKQ